MTNARVCWCSAKHLNDEDQWATGLGHISQAAENRSCDCRPLAFCRLAAGIKLFLYRMHFNLGVVLVLLIGPLPMCPSAMEAAHET